jgi:hypothetical protein
MKAWLATLFFLFFTVLLGVGCYRASVGQGLAVLMIGVFGYLGLFVRLGCLTH